MKSKYIVTKLDVATVIKYVRATTLRRSYANIDLSQVISLKCLLANGIFVGGKLPWSKRSSVSITI